MLFSVVVPSFNAEATIERAVRSVFAQDGADLEVLVVDDGSNDRTVEIARASAPSGVADQGRLKILFQDHRGAAAARNRGMTAARGDYIAFLDADDFWDPGYLAAAAAVWEEIPQADAVCFNSWQLLPEGHRLSTRVDSDRPVVLEDYFAARSSGTVAIQTSAVTLRSSTVARVGCMREDLLRAQDSEYWARIAAFGLRWVFSPTPLVYYDMTTRCSASRGPGSVARIPSLESWSRDIWPLLDPPLEDSFREMYLKRAKSYCGSLLRSGHYDEARATAREALIRAQDPETRLLLRWVAFGPPRLTRLLWLAPRAKATFEERRRRSPASADSSV